MNEIKLGVISNGDAVQQKQKLSALGIMNRFSTIVISGEVGVTKPDSRIFHLACRKAGVNPSECWHIGDDLKADVQGSIAAGMNGIWLNRYAKDRHVEMPMIESLTALKDNLYRTIRSDC